MGHTTLELKGPDGKVLFTHAELACKHCGNGILAPGFGDALVRLRTAFGQTMQINSACRCAFHNGNVGGHPKSLHVYDKPQHGTGGTCAVDVAMPDGRYGWLLLQTAMRLGWAVGINFKRNFIHLDRRMDYGIGTATLFSY